MDKRWSLCKLQLVHIQNLYALQLVQVNLYKLQLVEFFCTRCNFYRLLAQLVQISQLNIIEGISMFFLQIKYP